MRIELISLLGAIVGASTSLVAALYARWNSKRFIALANSKNVAWNSSDVNSSEVILENARQDVRDLQIQIELLQKILRDTKEVERSASDS